MDLPTAAATGSSGQLHRGPRLSMWKPHFSDGAIIEYSCGNCGKIVYYGLWKVTYCPHCDAPIFNFPRKKLDGPQAHNISYDDLGAMRYDGPDGRSRSLAGGCRKKPAKNHSHRSRPPI
jgi:hypothetical protein